MSRRQNRRGGNAGAPEEAFDADYYRRHYEDPETAVNSPEEVATLARFVFAYLDYLGVTIETWMEPER